MNVMTTQISAMVETITAEAAKAYLATSEGNRSLKRSKVAALKRDMIAGKFAINGESVIFDCLGCLIDGHHRLTACAESGKSIYSVVVRGIPRAAKKTVDTGASRTVGDHLSIGGMKNCNNLSAIINILLSLSKGSPRSASPSTTEVYAFIDQHGEGLHQAASFAATKAYARLANVFGAIYFVAIKTGEQQKAEAFKRVFATGIPDYPGCPAHLLRERLNSEAIKGKPSTPSDTQRLAFAAWEKFRIGAAARTLKAPTAFKLTGWN